MDLWEIALSFMDSQVLLTSVEFGVFDYLEVRSLSAGELGEKIGIPPESCERMLGALCALDIVQRDSCGRFSNNPEASARLVRGKPEYIGSMFRHLKRDLYPVWAYFSDSVRENRSQWHQAFQGRPSPTEEMYDDPEALDAFMNGMHAITYRTASEFAACAHELDHAGSVVDIGGASGAFLIALAERFPALTGTVFDLPAVRPVAERFIQNRGLADRIRFHAGDFWEDTVPVGADAYAMGFILHDWDTAGGSILLRKISEAVRPGGMLILGEYLLDPNRTGPLHVVRSDLNMMVAARGRERTADEYAAWIAQFGFRLERIQPVSGGRHYLIARH